MTHRAADQEKGWEDSWNHGLGLEAFFLNSGSFLLLVDKGPKEEGPGKRVVPPQDDF